MNSPLENDKLAFSALRKTHSMPLGLNVHITRYLFTAMLHCEGAHAKDGD